jgi:alpha-galactosidase
MRSRCPWSIVVVWVVASFFIVRDCFASETLPLSALDLTKMTAGWGEPEVDRSCVGKRMSIAGREFERGVGTHANSLIYVQLDGRAERFRAFVGVDDETEGKGSVRFKVYVDDKIALDSGSMKGGDAAKMVDVDLRGAKRLILLATSAGDDIHFDHADWAEASFEVAGAKPKAVDPPVIKEEKVILTPKPGPEPRINGPEVFGARPGRPFVYRIPCTGERPIEFSADNLPEGMTLDPKKGIVTGEVPQEPGSYVIGFTATNEHGSCQRPFRLVVGDRLALTPPMGWNSWYIHYHRVTEQHMRAAADAMIRSGMADVGYMYVNIDDCWMKEKGDEPYRDKQDAVLPNAKFPDIQGMVDYVHSKGLRAGTYISPGPWTCAGYVGSYQHEEIDAKKFAEWGFDFLKYDWCSYTQVATGEGTDRLQRPYRLMSGILKRLDRDIVLNLCQYGMGEVWKWGGEVGGNCWRTTGDLGLARGSRLPGFFHIGLSNAKHYQYAKPGEWNDPDYILIGWVGDARGKTEGKPTTLTASEQYSYMSMWCLMAAPLFFSGDMSKLDEFTLNVLCNPEVIEVDQDPLGKQARPIVQDDETLILAKPMEDGSLAVGLFNLEEFERPVRVTWPQLGITGPQRARDLWRQKDIGQCEREYTASVSRHGVMLIRLWPEKKD